MLASSIPSAGEDRGHCHSHSQPSPAEQFVLVGHPTVAYVTLLALFLLLQPVLQPGGRSEGESPALYHVLDALPQQPPSLLAPQRPHSSQPQPRCLLVTGVPAGTERAGVSCSPPTPAAAPPNLLQPPRLEWAPSTPLLTSPHPQSPGSSGGPCRRSRCCSGLRSTRCNTTLRKMGLSGGTWHFPGRGSPSCGSSYLCSRV